MPENVKGQRKIAVEDMQATYSLSISCCRLTARDAEIPVPTTPSIATIARARHRKNVTTASPHIVRFCLWCPGSGS